MKRGLFLVQLPPPVHGVSIVNERVVNDPLLRARIGIDVLRIDYTDDLAQINRITPVKGWRWLRLLARFAAALVRLRPDFVYFTPVPTGIGLLRDLPFIGLAKLSRRTLLLHLHGRGIAERTTNRAWRFVYERAFSGCALINASAGMRERELSGLTLRRARTYVVPNAVDVVDVARFSTERGRLEPVRLLFLSSTFPFKGVFVLLRALRMLATRGVAFEAEIVGDSTSANDAAIGAFLLDNGLTPRVKTRGALYGDDKYYAFGRADIFVHPTLNDYFPLVLLEAMQFGLAVVASDVGAIGEIVEDGRTGRLVPTGDAGVLADVLEALVHDEQSRRQFGARGRCRYLEWFVPERFSAALQTVLAAEGVV